MLAFIAENLGSLAVLAAVLADPQKAAGRLLLRLGLWLLPDGRKMPRGKDKKIRRALKQHTGHHQKGQGT